MSNSTVILVVFYSKYSEQVNIFLLRSEQLDKPTVEICHAKLRTVQFQVANKAAGARGTKTTNPVLGQISESLLWT
jgi:hypothetical protein